MRQPSLKFSWIVPRTNTKGEPLTEEEINNLEFRIYENGELAVDAIAEIDFELLMEGKPEGQYEYTMTAVLYGLESPHSEPAVVNFTTPAAPTNVTVEIVEKEALASVSSLQG